MIDSARKLGATQELLAINRELAALLCMSCAQLSTGAEAALDDNLVVCGILGGKDVGKSTLINALARCSVSVDCAEVGRGTERPMAYVHAAVTEKVAYRVAALDRDLGIDVTRHDADAIRNVVLVDLPDFDSEFQEHLRVVEKIAPLLDRVLWVQTPRKIGDRAWVDIFHTVIKDPGNVHFVLNKVDELLVDSDLFETNGEGRVKNAKQQAETFWREQGNWVAQAIDQAGCPASDEHRFLVAAAFPDSERFVVHIGQRWDDPEWQRFAEDRSTVEAIAHRAEQDLDRLRSRVLDPVTSEQACAIKEANRLREEQFNVDLLRRHYDLDRTIGLLTQACSPQYHQQVLNDAMGPAYCAAVAAGLRTRLRRDTHLADELLERRIEHWPLLQLVYWPLGWLSRAVGRRVSPRSQAATDIITDPFEVEGRSLTDRGELLRGRILADHAVVASQLALDAELPAATTLAKRAGAAASRLVPKLEDQLLNEAQQGDGKSSWIGKATLWLVLLWFPFLQPVLEGGLEMYVQTGTWRLAHGLYRIVAAFSAAHLLAGFAVVLAVYVGVLAIMYARNLRRVRAAMGEDVAPACVTRLTEMVDDLIVSEIMTALAQPFQDRLNRLASLQTRLDLAGEARMIAPCSDGNDP